MLGQNCLLSASADQTGCLKWDMHARLDGKTWLGILQTLVQEMLHQRQYAFRQHWLQQIKTLH